MPDFGSVLDWLFFEQYVAGRHRHFLNQRSQDFLSAVLATAPKRSLVLPKDQVVWRAQLGYAGPKWIDDYTIEFPPHPPERMKPLADKASEGRANPKGIPVLYVASDRETAMSEVRPGAASQITVARLAVTQDLRLVDCSTASSVQHPYHYVAIVARNGEPPPAEREAIAWGAINAAFSLPTDPSDYSADYAATQILADYFKGAGFEGIKYKSGFTDTGNNFALFNLDSADVIESAVHRVRRLQYEFGSFP